MKPLSLTVGLAMVHIMFIFCGTQLDLATGLPELPFFRYVGMAPRERLEILWRSATMRHPKYQQWRELAEAAMRTPPAPLQIYEYGAKTRKDYLEDYKKKYKHQYVCIMEKENKATWYVKRAPKRYKGDVPPFHVRIVRPCYPGILYHLLKKGKVEVELLEEEFEGRNGVMKKALVTRIKQVSPKRDERPFWKCAFLPYLPRSQE